MAVDEWTTYALYIVAMSRLTRTFTGHMSNESYAPIHEENSSRTDHFISIVACVRRTFVFATPYDWTNLTDLNGRRCESKMVKRNRASTHTTLTTHPLPYLLYDVTLLPAVSHLAC